MDSKQFAVHFFKSLCFYEDIHFPIMKHQQVRQRTGLIATRKQKEYLPPKY